jgi:hypothetical protein
MKNALQDASLDPVVASGSTISLDLPGSDPAAQGARMNA